MHSSEYRVPTEFSDTTVIVAGGGKSGQDIAADLAQNPTLSVIHASNKYAQHTYRFNSLYSIGTRNRIMNITKEANGTFTVHFQKGNKGPERTVPAYNVGAIIWYANFGCV